MTIDTVSSSSVTESQDPRKADMAEYVLVFADKTPPREHTFLAFSHEHAAEQMKKEYASSAWTLHHLDGGQRREIFRFPETT
jgi:hypothetical protein